MKALLLNAGYGTRLYPLTKNFPKGLLDINGKPIVEHLIEKIEETGIRDITIVSNARFFKEFLRWRGDKPHIQVLNDGSDSVENRRGAIGDIHFYLENQDPEDDLLILAGDNLFDFSLKEFVEKFRKEGKFMVGILKVEDRERIKRYGVVLLDEEGRILQFKEKPLHPFSNLAAIGIYAFPKNKLSLVKKYLEEGNNPDAPGYFIEWVSSREEVYGYIFEGLWYDIGSLETLEEARKNFQKEGRN